MGVILIDTSAYYAILDKSDKNHNKAVSFLQDNKLPLITTNLIVIETINLVNSRLGHDQAVLLGKKLFDKNLTTVINITPEDEKRAWQIFQKYTDKDFSLTDVQVLLLWKESELKKHLPLMCISNSMESSQLFLK